MSDPLVPRIVELLSAPESELRAEAAARYIDQLLAQRLADAVDIEEFVPLVLSALTQTNIARAVERHVQPGFVRFTDELANTTDRVGDLVSDAGKTALRAAVVAPDVVRGRWLKGAIDPKLIQRLLGPIWVQLLVSFAKRIPVPGLGGAMPNGAAAPTAAPTRSGIAGMLGRGVQQSAERLVDAGRSALGGLGIDLEAKLTAAARDFSDSAAGVWNHALQERLASPEGQAIVVQIKLGVVEHILRAQLGELREDASGLFLPRYVNLAPIFIAHGVKVPFIRGIVEREARAFVALEGERRLDELLAELGVLDSVRAWLVTRASRSLAEYSQNPAFADWIARVLQAAAASA
ncbi:MAG: hypothetical protein RL701_4381 [Pseudomonadota bacterium]|jgi:hypothetical protein